FSVTFDEKQTAVAPGQAVVLFDESDPTWILAGGWIAQAIK
ncbi:MAG: aminomethyltransferase beta-barrel domain-containing protein, partial [Phycisphaerae bacterium]